MEEIEVPQYFLCPISMEIMKDPVTVPSGITYDRQSIETWLYSNKNSSCPVTKLPISDADFLTPNHTLRRLIQAWCTLNSSYGIERFPTPKPPIHKSQIQKLISSAINSSPNSLLTCIRRLRSLSAESETNRRCVESAGAPEFLSSVITDSISSHDSDALLSCHEALSTLHNLRLSDSNLKLLTGNCEFFNSLTKVMKQGTYESRAYAVLILKSMVEIADPIELTYLKSELFVEVVEILKDQTSQQTFKAAMGILIMTCPWGRNRVKAVEAGGVGVLIEILLAATTERRVCEMALTAVDLLCGCADGRAAVLAHGGGMAVVSKKILRVSQVGSERAVRILHWIAKFSGSPAVLMEMAQLGIVAKLCLVLQVESGSKTKEKAREILKMHGRVWRNSPCIPTKLASAYPAI